MNLIDNYTRLYNSFDQTTKQIADNNRFEYIYSKAYALLKSDVEIYRRNDFYQLPHKTWSTAEIEGVKEGCQQLLRGKGLTIESPCVGLGISIFYRLFETFHFTPVHQKAKRVEIDGKKYFLDIIDFTHVIDGGIVSYCNLV